LTKESLLMLQW